MTQPPDNDMARIAALGSAFTPRAPISNRDMFSGRRDQLFAIMEATQSVGEHVVIYGERGVGKTSLASVGAAYAGVSADALAVRVNCATNDTFASIWQKIAEAIDVAAARYLRDHPNATLTEDDVDDALGHLLAGQPGTQAVWAATTALSAAQPVIVIDEFDRIRDRAILLPLVGDTVKALSDHLVDCTIIIVGVANDVSELLGAHESVGRSIRQVPMPRMSDEELSTILDNGYAVARLQVSEAARTRIIRLSQGMPHYAHLLGQESGRNAVLDGDDTVDVEHVHDAIERAVQNTEEIISTTYHRATSSPQDTLFPDVLLAAAMCNTDDRGYFRPVDLRPGMSALLGEEVHQARYNSLLPRLAQEDRGAVLERIGRERMWRYRFSQPLMKPYIIMQAIQNGRVDPESMTLVPPTPDVS